MSNNISYVVLNKMRAHSNEINEISANLKSIIYHPEINSFYDIIKCLKYTKPYFQEASRCYDNSSYYKWIEEILHTKFPQAEEIIVVSMATCPTLLKIIIRCSTIDIIIFEQNIRANEAVVFIQKHNETQAIKSIVFDNTDICILNILNNEFQEFSIDLDHTYAGFLKTQICGKTNILGSQVKAKTTYNITI